MDNSVDEVIWSEKNASVSRTALKVGKKTYSILGIGSVEVRHEGRGKMLALGLLMIAVTVVTAVLAGPFAIIPGAFALSAFVGAFGDMHELVIRTASGELQAMKGKRRQLEQVKAAIEQAFTLR